LYDPEQLPSGGVCFRIDRYRVKILKAEDGGPPISNITKSRTNFMRQQLPPDYEVLGEPIVNLMLVWQVDRERKLSSLQFICTTQADLNSNMADVYWTFPVPDLISAIIGPKEVEIDDLPIGEMDEKETGTR